jgi:glycosyltransferase involved in cell wall biosynthesis
MQQRFPDAVLAGMRTGADLAAHYASADVFLFPSLTETFGNVTLEAMASGLALVAFDYAAARELVRDGESGVLAAYGDARAFVERAAALIGDGARIRRLGARARVEASGRDWERVVLQLEATLADAATRAVPGNLAAGVAAAA